MKKKNIIDNYVFLKYDRDISKYFVPYFCIPLLLVYLLFFWILLFRYPDNEVHLFFASILSLLNIALIVYFYKHRTINEMQFHIGEHTITNTTPKKKDLKLNLFDPLYISHIFIKIARGRSFITQEFYLFASRPFSNDDYKGDDTVTTLEYLHKRGIIIFPKNEKVDEWLGSELKINDIPEFPRSVIFNTENQFGNGIDSSVGLMTDG